MPIAIKYSPLEGAFFEAQTKDSEIALVVSEKVRRLGLGRVLLKQLIQLAKDGASKTVRAYVATRNAPVITLLRSEGFDGQAVDAAGDLELTFDLTRA